MNNICCLLRVGRGARRENQVRRVCATQHSIVIVWPPWCTLPHITTMRLHCVVRCAYPVRIPGSVTDTSSKARTASAKGGEATARTQRGANCRSRDAIASVFGRDPSETYKDFLNRIVECSESSCAGGDSIARTRPCGAQAHRSNTNCEAGV